MTGPALTPDEALRLLSQSGLLTQAHEQSEADRTRRRRAILEAARQAEAAAQSEASAAARAVAEQRARVESVRRTLAAEHARLIDAERNVWLTDDAVARCVRGAEHDLRDLGSSAIDGALGALRWAERESTGRIAFRERRDAYGRLLATTEADPEHSQRARRMRALADELEALRLADLSPAEVERRCAAAVAEVVAGAPPRVDDGERLRDVQWAVGPL